MSTKQALSRLNVIFERLIDRGYMLYHGGFSRLTFDAHMERMHRYQKAMHHLKFGHFGHTTTA